MTKTCLAAAAALLTALTGCTAAPAAAPPARAHDPQPRAAAGGVPAFVAAVQREFPALTLDRRDEEWGAVAERACSELAAGQTPARIITHTRTLGTQAGDAADEPTARRLVTLAITTVCPGQDRRVSEF